MNSFELNIPLFPPDARRKRWFMYCSGLLATTLVGGTVVPWAWSLLLSISSPIWSHSQPPIPFPNPLLFLLSPNWITSGIWLLYYLVATFAKSTAAGIAIAHQLSSLGIQLTLGAGDHLGMALYHTLQRKTSGRNKTFSFPDRGENKLYTPLPSQAWKGEAKYACVEDCYQTYRHALARYQPLPFLLHTPEIFYYHESPAFDYMNTSPVLPQELLTKEHREELLPLLAHHLYWYNLQGIGDLHMWTLALSSNRWLLPLTGNFLWLPADYCERLTKNGAWIVARKRAAGVLEADTFAVLLGQGPALERQLRLFQKHMKECHIQDTSTPTIAERIGHLEALNKQEEREVRFLLNKARHDRSLNAGA